MDLTKLKEPFPIEKISWRVGATNVKPDGSLAWGDVPMGIPLAYIDARDVMERLDKVCGPELWQNEYPFKGCCRIGIFLGSEWVWKSNGAGETQVEADKGQYSDAFKRAGVQWGIGRYLYDVPNIWVELEKKGRSYVIKDPKGPKLEGLLKKAEAIARREKVLTPESGRPETKQPFTETEMNFLIEKIEEADNSIALESAKGLARDAYPRMESTQKAKITKKIKERETSVGNREMDNQFQGKVTA